MFCRSFFLVSSIIVTSNRRDGGMSIENGCLCYFLEDVNSWTLGRVVQWDGKTGSVKSEEDGKTYDKVTEPKIFVAREDCVGEDVDDLLCLTLLHDSTLLACLKTRYFKDVIYTNIGAIVVAINPYNFKIPWYMDDQMPKYLAEGTKIEQNKPHSWAQAHNTYWEMIRDNENQTILVSGESGAGKTEASKIVFKYLSAVSSLSGTDAQKAAGGNVGMRINNASPPLEAFGNAKTVRNDNSSRFGKFMKVKFSSEGFLVGAHITKYLLEKSRIVSAMPNERLYHSFYLLCRDPNKAKYNINSDNDFKSLTSGNCTSNKDFDTIEEHTEVISSMKTIGLSDDQITSVWKSVAGVMHLLNASFEQNGEGSEVSGGSLSHIEKTSENWGIDTECVQKELTTTEMEVMGQMITKELKVVQSIDGRDAVCKAIYNNLFTWFIEMCNNTLDVDSDGPWIGLLDIFGFEDFEINSFEQLCINLANETLQGHYNSYIFQRDMDECRAEGVDVTSVQFPDNGPCLAMITSKTGILALLDSQCSVGSGSDEGFLMSIEETHKSNPFFAKKMLAKHDFIVHHYAGSVSYTVTGFLDKNRDTLKDAWKLLLRTSTDELISTLLPEPVDTKGPKITAGGYFKSQLNQLMNLINSTNPHWIRCVKPHPAKKPRLFHGSSTMQQLASAGVLGTVKIRKAGYPVRISFDEFCAMYRIITTGKDIDTSSSQSMSADILKLVSLSSTMAQIGKTRVFMKSEAYIALETIKKDTLMNHAQVTQAFCRAIVARQTKVKPKLRGASKEILAFLRKGVRKVAQMREKEEAERAETEEEEALEWLGLKEEYHHFIETELVELMNAEARKKEAEEEMLRREEAERLQKEEERRAVCIFSPFLFEVRKTIIIQIERRKEERERKRQEQKQKEKELRDSVTQLNNAKRAEVEKEVMAMRKQRKEAEEMERMKAAAARKAHQNKMSVREEKLEAVRQRRQQNMAEKDTYEDCLAKDVMEQEKWTSLLTSRSRNEEEHRQLVKGMGSSLRAAEGKARASAQQQRFLRLTEVKQAEAASRDFYRSSERERQQEEIENNRRLDRIRKAERKRAGQAAAAAVKANRSKLETRRLTTKNEWEELLEKEKRRKKERNFQRAQEAREETMMIKGVEAKIARGMALRDIEERQNTEKQKIRKIRSSSQGISVGGTHTADVYTPISKVDPIDRNLYQKLLGSEKTAAAGTLNDMSCKQVPHSNNNKTLHIAGFG